MLRVSDLSLSLSERPILRNISFSVETGEFLCIIGKNGAGKSTLFKCIAGIYSHYKGEVEVAGEPLSRMSANERGRRIAYVPQSAPLDIPYTVTEFLEMARYPWRKLSSGADDRRAVSEAIDVAGIGHLADRRMENLSGGERQKVMLASAIAQGTSLILLDEPTTYLDYAHQVETVELVRNLNRERGITLMAVTHDINMAATLSTRVIAMDEGELVWASDRNGVYDPARLEALFGVPFRLYFSRREGDAPVVLPAGAA